MITGPPPKFHAIRDNLQSLRSEHLYALPQDHGKLVIKILEIRPRGPVHRGRFLVAVPADFTAIPPGDTVEPPGRPHRQRVTFRAG
jgi:hypothetical protein